MAHIVLYDEKKVIFLKNTKNVDIINITIFFSYIKYYVNLSFTNFLEINLKLNIICASGVTFILYKFSWEWISRSFRNCTIYIVHSLVILKIQRIRYDYSTNTAILQLKIIIRLCVWF